MFTKPQDVVVALALCSGATPSETYAELARSLGMSASEVHACVRRLSEARLVEPNSRNIRREALLQFLLHGVPYAFPARTKEITRGLPTAWAAPVMSEKLDTSDQLPPVWPDPEGTVQGVSLQPLYPSVPKAARNHPDLYDLLALVDAIRIGRARERAIATTGLKQRLLADLRSVQA